MFFMRLFLPILYTVLLSGLCFRIQVPVYVDDICRSFYSLFVLCSHALKITLDKANFIYKIRFCCGSNLSGSFGVVGLSGSVPPLGWRYVPATGLIGSLITTLSSFRRDGGPTTVVLVGI
jgi:hypothetical protein